MMIFYCFFCTRIWYKNLALLAGFQYDLMLIQKWITFYWATPHIYVCCHALANKHIHQSIWQRDWKNWLAFKHHQREYSTPSATCSFFWVAQQSEPLPNYKYIVLNSVNDVTFSPKLKCQTITIILTHYKYIIFYVWPNPITAPKF